MIRFSREATPPSLEEPHVRLALEIAWLDSERSSDNLDYICTVVYSAVVSGIDCQSARGFFEDNQIGIGFAEWRQTTGPIGDICCMGNSSRTDLGIQIEISAAGVLAALNTWSPWPPPFSDGEPFAKLRLWFPLYARDGLRSEHVVDKMLDEQPRPLLRLELADCERR
jgi:hypothetical protein